MLTFVMQHPAAFGLLGLTGTFLGVGTQVPTVGPIAYATVCFFIALGPFAWIERAVVAKPGEEG